MVKSYLRYKGVRDGCFGIVTSAASGSAAFASVAFDQSGQIAIVPALEYVALWHIRNATMVHQHLHHHQHQLKTASLNSLKSDMLCHHSLTHSLTDATSLDILLLAACCLLVLLLPCR
jgi:hypothetical protein